MHNKRSLVEVEHIHQYAKRARTDEWSQLQNSRNLLERTVRKIQTGLCDIATAREAHHQLQRIAHQESQFSVRDSWTERIEQLQNVQTTDHASMLAVKAILSSTLKQDINPIFVDSDRCSCGRLFRFEVAPHMNLCTVCRVMQDVLVIAEDSQTDLLSFRNQKTSTSIALTVKEKAARKNKPKNVVKKTHKNGTISTVNSDRAQAYRRQFLAQFDINAPPPSDDVFQLLYTEFGNFHILNSFKCRPTDVAAKLKARNMYAHQSIKIARMFNAEPMIEMETSLIDALVQRFEDVSVASNMMKPAYGKLSSFEILTHMFLRAEKRDDLASIFFIHKPATILSTPDERLRKLIDKCHELQKQGICKSDWSDIPRSG